jgi:hypothetical protein
MTRPFSGGIAAFEVAFGISFLLSVGYRGEQSSILRRSDRTDGPLVRYLRAFSRFAPSGIRQSSRKLLIGAVIELGQSIETELGDPGGHDLASGPPCFALNPVDDSLQPPGIDVALVRGPDQGAAELPAVERLAVAVPLDHLDGLGDSALVGGEAVPARRALTTPAKGATIGSARLERLAGSLATGTVHSLNCS